MFNLVKSGMEFAMGIDWTDKDMVEMIDFLIENPLNVRKYANCINHKEIAEAINHDYPELEVSISDIPRLISMVKVKYANGW